MAPRSAKTKKATDVKTSENEIPTKVKVGKEKINPEPELDAEEEKLPVGDKKSKRGKKTAITTERKQTNGDGASVSKKDKKKKDEMITDKLVVDEDDTEDPESGLAEENEQYDDGMDSNGHTEEAQIAPASRGRKKNAKKNSADTKSKELNKNRSNLKQNEEENKKEVSEDKPKGRGRGRKIQQKPDLDLEGEEKSDNAEEDTKPVTKGRKKGQAKAAKEKTPELEIEELQEDQTDVYEAEEEPEPKKSRGKRNTSKKAHTKVELEDKEEENKGEPVSKKRKVIKKEEKGKGEPKDADVEDDVPEPKTTKGKRGQKKVVEKSMETEEKVQDTGEPTTKRRRKQAEDKVLTQDSNKKPPPKNKAATNYDSIDFSNSTKSPQGKEWNFKIASWNVDGVRAWFGKGGLDYIKYEKPDILCLQELKCRTKMLPEDIANLPGYHAYWLCSDKDGYAGVGIYTTKLAMNVQYGLGDEELDTEGRIITAEYEQFYLICTYVPNSGRKLVTLPKRLKWNEEFRKHVKSLDKKKPVIICGDMNVSHNEIDLTNPKPNRNNAGFTDQERAGMTELLGEGFVDTYRHLYPNNSGAYTFWTYMSNSRAKNVGWRLDYFIVSKRLLPAVCDNVIREEVYGSDHCPISLFLHLSTADKPKE